METNTNSTTVFEPIDWEELRRTLSPESVTHLEHSLASLEKGRDPTPAFPLYGLRGEALLKKFKDEFPWNELPQWLAEYELGRLEKKFGPQGGVPAWTVLKEDCQLYVTAGLPVTYVDPEIIGEMKKDYAFHLPMLSSRQVIPTLIHDEKLQDRAAGWPEYQLKKTDKRAQVIAVDYANNGRYRDGIGYVFTRFNKQKNRIFFPMPFCQNVVQDKFFIPLLSTIQERLRNRTPGLMPWADKLGFEFCFDSLEDEIRENRGTEKNLFYFSNDFLKMDTCTGHEQYTKIVWPVMRNAVASLKLEDLLLGVTAPIITPSGIIRVNHGTASGITMTNGGETICNDYYVRRLKKLLKPYGIRVIAYRVNGDDSIIILVSDKSLDEVQAILLRILSQLQEETGLRTQTEKLSISDERGVYCQNVLTWDGKSLFWTYPATLIFNSITNPEHEYTHKEWTPEFRDQDVIQKLDNGVHHPKYGWLVNWVDRGMKYGLAKAGTKQGDAVLATSAKYRALQPVAERWNREWKLETSPTFNRK